MKNRQMPEEELKSLLTSTLLKMAPGSISQRVMAAVSVIQKNQLKIVRPLQPSTMGMTIIVVVLLICLLYFVIKVLNEPLTVTNESWMINNVMMYCSMALAGGVWVFIFFQKFSKLMSR